MVSGGGGGVDVRQVVFGGGESRENDRLWTREKWLGDLGV